MIVDPLEAEAERLFADYLRSLESEAPADPARLLAGADREVAARFRAMLADYAYLRTQAWSAGVGLTTGRRIAGFRLVRPAGSGACGTVWEAEQEALDRRVALKILHPHLHLSERAVRRFRQEAASAAQLEHPAIVRILEVGEEDGISFLAQELLEGGSLAERLAARRAAPDSARFDDFREIARTFAVLAEALHVAHTAGIVHRDVKPANILFDADGAPRLVDFGLALVAEDGGATWSGSVAGTLAYASPEQLRGEKQRPDARSDVFSLGATLYETLTLRRAFEGDSQELLIRRVLTEDPPDPRSIRAQIPRDLGVICLKAIEKIPSRRYASARELAEDLHRFLEGRPILARPAGRVERVLRWCRRHPAAAGAIAVLGGSALIVGMLLVSTRRAEQAEARARGAAQDLLATTVDLLAFADPANERRAAELPGARELSALVAQVWSAEPGEHAETLLAIGGTYCTFARYDDAAELLGESRRLFTSALGPSDRRSRAASLELARVHEDSWEHERAAIELQGALALELAEPEPRAPRIASIAARLHRVLALREDKPGIDALDARVGGLELLLRDAIAHAEPTPTLERASLRTGLGRFLLAKESPAEALELAEAASADLSALVPDPHPAALHAIELEADALCALNRNEESELRYRRLVALTGSFLGVEHPYYLHALWATGEELQEQDRLAEAEDWYLRSIEGWRNAFGEQAPPLLLARRGYAILLVRMRRADEALEVLDAIEPALEIALDRTHLDVIIARRARVEALHSLGRLDEAHQVLLEQLERQIEGRGESHHQTLNTLTYLTRNATARGDFDEAVARCRQALEFGATLDERFRGELHADLASALTTAGRLEEAREELERAVHLLGNEAASVLLARGDLAAAEGDERTARACYDAWESRANAPRDILGQNEAVLAVRRALLRVRVEGTEEARTELRAAEAAVPPWLAEWRYR